MNVLDNTKTIFAFPPVGQFMPEVLYAPEDETGSGETDVGAKGETQSDEDVANAMYGEDKNGDDKNGEDKNGDDKNGEDKNGEDKNGEDKNGEDKNGDDKNGDDKNGDDDKDAKEVDLKTVPEDGVYKLTMPEGVKADQVLVDKLSPMWKDKGLTHEDVQAMNDVYVERIAEARKEAAEQWETTQTEWGDSAKADKEFGGENFDANVKIATDVIEQFGNDELKAALNTSGMGNHPEVIRFMWNIGKSITEDDVPNASEGNRNAKAKTPEGLADDMYSGTTPKERER